MKELESNEKVIFPVIQKVLTSLKGTAYKFVAGDSTVVRAFTPYVRDIEDFDLIFPHETNIHELKEFISRTFPLCRQDNLVIIETKNNIGYFLRTKFPIDIVYHLEKYFIVDFHIGGSVYKSDFACSVDDIFFKEIQWKKIKSASGLEEANLPVTPIEEFLLFKLRKYLGRDNLDIITLLMTNHLKFENIKNRAEFYNITTLKMNLYKLKESLANLITQWEYSHFDKITDSKLKILKKNITDLKKIIR